jgi:hypothetical protein
MIDLEYDPQTLWSPAEPDRFRKLEGWWSWTSGRFSS